jgi:hypothetical protein
MYNIYLKKLSRYGEHVPFTAEARVRARFNPFGICGRQSGTDWDRFFSEFFGFPVSKYNSTVALQTLIIGGMNSVSVSGSSSETWSHAIDINQSMANA